MQQDIQNLNTSHWQKQRNSKLLISASLPAHLQYTALRPPPADATNPPVLIRVYWSHPSTGGRVQGC